MSVCSRKSMKKPNWQLLGLYQPHDARQRCYRDERSEQDRTRCLFDPYVVLSCENEDVQRGWQRGHQHRGIDPDG